MSAASQRVEESQAYRPPPTPNFLANLRGGAQLPQVPREPARPASGLGLDAYGGDSDEEETPGRPARTNIAAGESQHDYPALQASLDSSTLNSLALNAGSVRSQSTAAKESQSQLHGVSTRKAKMSAAPESEQEGLEGDMSLSGVARAPQSTLAKPVSPPKKDLSYSCPPPAQQLPPPSPSRAKKREPEPMPEARPSKQRKSGERIGWNSEEPQSYDDEEESEGQRPPSSQHAVQRGFFDSPAESPMLSYVASPTQKVDTGSQAETGNDSIDDSQMMVDSPFGITPEAEEPETQTRDMDLESSQPFFPAQQQAPLPSIAPAVPARRALNPNRALSRASELDLEEDEPTQLSKPSDSNSDDSHATIDAVPPSEISHITDSEKVRRDLNGASSNMLALLSSPRLKGDLAPSSEPEQPIEGEEVRAVESAVEEDRSESPAPVAKEPATSRAQSMDAEEGESSVQLGSRPSGSEVPIVLIKASAPRKSTTPSEPRSVSPSEQPVAGPSKRPPPAKKGQNKRRTSKPPKLNDYYDTSMLDSDSDPEIVIKAVDRSKRPSAIERIRSGVPAPAPVVEPEPEPVVDEEVADLSDEETQEIMPKKKDRRSASTTTFYERKTAPQRPSPLKKYGKSVSAPAAAPVRKDSKSKGKGKAKAEPALAPPLRERTVSVTSIDDAVCDTYVLAYWPTTRSFYPAKVIECLIDGLTVQSGEGTNFKVLYADIRKCIIREGDHVQYWGTEDAEGRERLQDVAEVVMRVEDHATSEDLVDCVPNEDDLVVCEPRANQGGQSARYCVKAICYGRVKQLEDRKLTPEDIAAYQSQVRGRRKPGLIPQTSVHLLKSSSVAPRSSSVPARSNLFERIGLLVTGLPAVADATQPVTKQAFEETVTNAGAGILAVTDVFDAFDGASSSGSFAKNHVRRNRDNVFLVAPRPAATSKYLAALALGVPCLSIRWIEACIEEESVVDWRPYLLSAALHTGLGVQCKLLSHNDFDVIGLERRNKDLAFLKNQNVLYLALGSFSQADIDERRLLPLALGAARVDVTAVAARFLKPNQLAQADLVLVDDHRGDATEVQHAKVLTMSDFKECVYIGRLPW